MYQMHNLLLHSYHLFITVLLFGHMIVFSLCFDFPPHTFPMLNLFVVCVWNGMILDKWGKKLWATSNEL